MSSSPVTPVSVEQQVLTRPGLLELLERVPDPRARRGVCHRLAVILAVGLAAVVAGATSFAAIGEWVVDADGRVLSELGACGGRRPSEATIRRALGRVDGDLLDGLVGAWMRTRVGMLAGRRVIAVDGKTVRGAKAAGGSAPHLVAALDHGLGVVLGQLQVAVKSNEIPALRTLLDTFDLTGAVITADAMHTQTAAATYIAGRGGHYVFTVKANQPGLYDGAGLCPGTGCGPPAPWTAPMGAGSAARSRSPKRPRSSTSPTRSRSPRSDAPAPPPGRRPSRSSTSSPPCRRPRPHRSRSPPGSKATGASRTACTGSATSPTTKTRARVPAASPRLVRAPSQNR